MATIPDLLVIVQVAIVEEASTTFRYCIQVRENEEDPIVISGNLLVLILLSRRGYWDELWVCHSCGGQLVK